MKVVINNCYGGFGLSRKAVEILAAKGCQEAVEELEDDRFYGYLRIQRTDKDLVEVVELLGKEASGSMSSLKVVDIPDDIEWEIEEYDGIEWVAEKHRTWG